VRVPAESTDFHPTIGPSVNRLSRLSAVLVALVVALLAPSAAADHSAAEPPAPDRLAYAPIPWYGEQGQLTVVNADGTDLRKLPTEAYAPRWSPDGTRIAFLRDRDLYAISPDGTNQDRLTAVTDVSSGPEWSPNGDRLVAQASGRLVFVDADGTDVSRTAQERVVSAPVWSPDGGRVAFAATDPASGLQSLVTLAPDGTDRRVLLDAAVAGSVSPPAWTPDGAALVVSVQRVGEDGCCQLWRVGADGGGARPLAEVTGGNRSPEMARPAVSPDGSTVAFTAGGLFVVPLEGGEVRRVADGPSILEFEGGPSWSADGRRIAFDASDDGSDSGCHCTHSEPLVVDVADGTVTRPAKLHTGILQVDFSPGVARRLAGLDRVGTALALSRAGDPELSDGGQVVLARSDEYADALAAAPFTALRGGRLLLTGGDRLDERVARELQRVRPETVVLLGSQVALSARVEADVRALGLEVERIAGATRFETAEQLAYQTDTFPERTFLVQGADADRTRGWPDAVAVGALAAQRNNSILLTYRDSLPEATLRALHTQVTPRVTIVGGTSAVSAAVEEQLRAEGFAVDRLAGATRYETSALIAQEASANFDRSGGAHVGIVTGANWPDALAAATSLPFGSVLLLVDPAGLDGSPATRDVLATHASDVADVTLVGGPDVLSPTVEVQVERLLADW